MQQSLTDTISKILVMHLVANSTAMLSTCAFMDSDARGPQGDDSVTFL